MELLESGQDRKIAALTILFPCALFCYIGVVMDSKFMKMAFSEAKKAFDLGEIPVGAIIVKDNKVIAKSFNIKEKINCSLGHAELLAIQKASQKIGNWRLDDCDLYVTLEPCPMCASAIKQSRIRNVFCAIASTNKESSEIVSRIFSSIDNNPAVKFYNNLDTVNGNEILNSFFYIKRNK